VAYTPGSSPLWSAITLGSTGTRKNTNPDGQVTAPSPQLRSPSEAKYRVNPEIWLAAANVAPPSADRANANPSVVFTDGVSRVPQET
jgi:hypothetical protein